MAGDLYEGIAVPVSIAGQQPDAYANIAKPISPPSHSAEHADGGIGEALYQMAGPAFNRGLSQGVFLPHNAAHWVAEKAGAPQGVVDALDVSKNRFTKPLYDYLEGGAKPETTLGKYGERVGEFIGSSVIPGVAVTKAAPIIAAARPAVTATGQVVQNAAKTIAANPGNAAAWDLAGNVTGGASAQAAEDAGAPRGVQNLAGMVGGIAPAALTGMSHATRSMVARARANVGETGAYSSIADDIGGNVDQFADQIASGASRGNVATNRRTLDILGEEMMRHRGDAVQATQATINRIATEQNVAPSTAAAQIRRLTAVHEDNPLFFGEYPTVAKSDAAQRMRQPGNVDLDALGRRVESPATQTMDYLANNGNAQSATAVRNAITERQEELSPQFREMLANIGPQVRTGPRSTRPADITDAQDMINDARTLGGQAYDAAYNGPINQTLMDQFVPRLLNWHSQRAMTRAGDPRAAIERAISQFYTSVPGGPAQPMATLQQLQDARGAVRGQITEYARSGRNDLVNAVQPFYDHVTRVMEATSPLWGRANAQWADMNFNRMGQELGDAFATKAGPQYRAQMQEFNNLAPQAQDIVRVHFLQKLYDKLDNLGDTHSVSKMFANDQSRNMIRTMFGDEAAATFARAVRDQGVAESTSNMTKNSATHRRGVAQKQKDADTGIVSAMQNANPHALKGWVLEKAQQALTENRNRPLADITTTPMSDTARVAEHLARMRDVMQRMERYNRPTSAMPPVTNPLAGILVDQSRAGQP